MAHAFKSIGKLFKSFAPTLLPIAASFIPGIGPLGMALASGIGSAVGGGSIGQDLLSAGLGGLGAGAFGSAPGTSGVSALDSVNSGIYDALSPLRNLATSAGNGLQDMLGISNTSALSGGSGAGIGGDLADNAGGDMMSPLSSLSSGGGANVLPLGASQDAIKSFLENGPTGAGSAVNSAFGGATAADVGTGGSFWDKFAKSISNNPLKAIGAGASIANALSPGNYGQLSQKQIQDNINKQQAAQAAKDAAFISSLGKPLDRSVQAPQTDYYTYGQRPEQLFYDNVNPQAPGQAMAKGGMPKSPLQGLGGQDDTVKAQLSHGEYVIPADVVGHLGDGNSTAGGAKLDDMVKKVRKLKAPALKKGVLPPKAQSPLAMMGAM